MSVNYKGQCKCCPIHPHSEEGMKADATGCLPSFYEMYKWQQETGKIWACHNNNKKPCSGFVGVLNEKGIDWNTNKGFITESCTTEEIYNPNSVK